MFVYAGYPCVFGGVCVSSVAVRFLVVFIFLFSVPLFLFYILALRRFVCDSGSVWGFLGRFLVGAIVLKVRSRILFHAFFFAHSKVATIEEDINELLAKLNFSEEEAMRVVSTKVGSTSSQGFETWDIGKLMAEGKVNREAMYRVFKSLWFTKEEVNFVSLIGGAILVRFGNEDDRKRILNLSPCCFTSACSIWFPTLKIKSMEEYAFNRSQFWVRVSNIPLEFMDMQMAMEFGNAIREVLAIDWRDRDGGWTEYMRLRVDNSKSNKTDFQYGNWLRAPLGATNQNCGPWRNGIEIITDNKESESASNGMIQETLEVSELKEQVETERVKNAEDESKLSTQQGKRPMRVTREGIGKKKTKRKRIRGTNGEITEESPGRIVRRKLLDCLTPSKATAGEQPR
ncbi:hypothetical protein J1N35_013832 [Gossypium stocksii]|uniref:DUF4283 domain-containing protein n=1 Tax=Gossypium stocksii TaxID=47602 RepID=A0A9D3VUK8_9ROSI|nr:hypothetical protein J1N35_013832 [Gossypium stocksii]